MTGLSVKVLAGFGNGANGPRGGSAFAASLMGTARQEAIMRQTTTRLIVDTAYSSSTPSNYLHRLTVAYLWPSTASTSGTNWLPASKWEPLPANAYVYYNLATTGSGTNPSNTSCLISQSNGMQILAGTPEAGAFGLTATGYYDYFQFNSAGQLQMTGATNGTAELWVAPGFINTAAQPPSLQLTGTSQMFPFAIFRLGRIDFFSAQNQ
jgi:hypothetical protein